MSYPQVSKVQRVFALSFLFCAGLISGCGSDDNTTSSSSSSSSLSSSSSSSSSSVVSGDWPNLNIQSVQPKTLTISWDSVPDATFYRVYKDLDGASGFIQLGADITTNTITDAINVHQHDWQNARYMVEACNASSCSNSNEMTSRHVMLDAIGYFKAANANAYDWFGWSLALSADGSTLAISATQEDSAAIGVNGDQDSNTAVNSGAVYVFALTDNTWSQQAYLKASNTEQPSTNTDGVNTSIINDRFGYSLSLSDDGNTLAVSALLEDSNATGINGDETNNEAADAGAVYIFERSNAIWQKTTYLKASNTPEEEAGTETEECVEDETTVEIECAVTPATNIGDRFGNAVALSGDGNTLAVGALGEDSDATGINGTEDNNLFSGSGAVYVFVRSADSWVQEAYVKPATSGISYEFGSSVSLSSNGDTLAVGAPGEFRSGTGINSAMPENTNAVNSGAAYIFTKTDNAWQQYAHIKTTHTSTSQLFGFSVSLSGAGNTLAVSAYGESSAATGVNGDPTDIDTGSFSNYFSGAAYIFEYSDSTWQQTSYLKAANSGAGDVFGHHLALSNDGNHLAVGAYFEDSNALGINNTADDDSTINTGAVYVFSKTAGSWQQSQYVKAKDSDNNDRFGHSVALSDDGSTLAASAYREASNTTGINSTPNNETEATGAVYLY